MQWLLSLTLAGALFRWIFRSNEMALEKYDPTLGVLFITNQRLVFRKLTLWGKSKLEASILFPTINRCYKRNAGWMANPYLVIQTVSREERFSVASAGVWSQFIERCLARQGPHTGESIIHAFLANHGIDPNTASNQLEASILKEIEEYRATKERRRATAAAMELLKTLWDIAVWKDKHPGESAGESKATP
jgi:hypothetical protein